MKHQFFFMKSDEFFSSIMVPAAKALMATYQSKEERGKKLQYLSDIEPKNTGPYGTVLSDVFGQNAHETKQKVNLEKDLPTPIVGRRKYRGTERGIKAWLPSRGIDVVYEDKSDRSGFIRGWRDLSSSFQEWFETSDYWLHNSIEAGKRRWIPITISIVFGLLACVALSDPVQVAQLQPASMCS